MRALRGVIFWTQLHSVAPKLDADMLHYLAHVKRIAETGELSNQAEWSKLSGHLGNGGNESSGVARSLLDNRAASSNRIWCRPAPDTLAFLNEALARLREIPFSFEPARRIECLLSIAQQFYHQGQNVFSGVEPAALAVMLAR